MPSRQFYKLSKANHPDLHPNDTSKSKRFVAISEAYSILGSAEKRKTYDRDFLPAAQPFSGASDFSGHRGSYSSHSSPAGGRPASGLSKRRTQFKGPPPSFYRQGGYGAHSEKRSQHATSGPEGTYDHPSAAGTGPGGFTQGVDNDVPHFDQHGHQVRHENLDRSRHKARRRVERTLEDLDYSGGSSPLFQFVMISGVLGIILGVGSFVSGGTVRPVAKKKENDDGK
jgi:curved DNA-binding protein CbpA